MVVAVGGIITASSLSQSNFINKEVKTVKIKDVRID
jgi:hypothetical protein